MSIKKLVGITMTCGMLLGVGAIAAQADYDTYDRYPEDAMVLEIRGMADYKNAVILNPNVTVPVSDYITVGNETDCWYDSEGNVFYIDNVMTDHVFGKEAGLYRFDGQDSWALPSLNSTLPYDQIKLVTATVARPSFNGKKVWIQMMTYTDDGVLPEYILLDMEEQNEKMEVLRVPFSRENVLGTSVVASPEGKYAVYSVSNEDVSEIYQVSSKGTEKVFEVDNHTLPIFQFCDDRGNIIYSSITTGHSYAYVAEKQRVVNLPYITSITSNRTADQFLFSDGRQVYFYSFDMDEPMVIMDGSQVGIITPEDMRYESSYAFMYNYASFPNRMIGTDSFDHMCCLVESEESDQLVYIEDIKNGKVTLVDDQIMYGYNYTNIGGLTGYNGQFDFGFSEDCRYLVYRKLDESMWKLDLDSLQKEQFGETVLAYNKDLTKVFEMTGDDGLVLRNCASGDTTFISSGEGTYALQTFDFTGITYREGDVMKLVDFDGNVSTKEIPEELKSDMFRNMACQRGVSYLAFREGSIWNLNYVAK